MSEKQKKIFIGEKRVKEIRDTNERTPGNAMISEIEFEDGKIVRMPRERLEVIRTDHVSTATDVRKKLVMKVSPAVYGFFHEFDLTMEEFDDVMEEIVRLGNAASEKATNILWGVDFAPQRSLLMTNKILSTKSDEPKKEDNNNGTTAAGSGVDPKNSN